MKRKIIKLILAVISISGLMLMLFTIGGIDAGLFEGLMLKRILIGLAMFGFPIGIAALAEANDANS